MERKRSRYVFLKNHVFYGKDVFPDACLISGCVSGCLPCAPVWNLASGGSKISNKNTFSGLGLGILPPAGQRSQTKHVPGNKNTHI